MGFPVADLARRVTEFQVAEDAEGRLVGAAGLQVAERQGLIHSEVFEDFALADQLTATALGTPARGGDQYGLAAGVDAGDGALLAS